MKNKPLRYQTLAIWIVSGVACLLCVAPRNALAKGPFPTDKWHPGIYVKLEDWQLQSPSEIEKIYKELEATPQLRGIKVVLFWGRYESKNIGTGVISYDFSQIDGILSKLATLDNKHLILSFPWRDFTGTSEAEELLPNDLRANVQWTDPNSSPPDWSHTKYDYLWAYQMNNSTTPSYGYNLKLWDPMILSRIDAFLKALAEHIDSHPNFNHMSTTESAVSSPVIIFGPGESVDLQYQGQIAVIRSMKKYFVHSLVIPAFNFDRPHLANNVMPILEKEGIGLGSPNSNKHQSLIISGSSGGYPGVLTYYPKLSGKVPLAPEIQGEDYQRTYGPGSPTDNPSYEYLYLRVRDDLKANYTVMQRNTPYWLGNSDTPSMLEFIQTYPTIVNDATGAGGLDAVEPGGNPSLEAPKGFKVK